MRELADAGEVNDALLQNQIIEAVAGGDVWVSGCEVTPSTATTQVEVEVAGGEVRINGARVGINPQQAVLDNGDGANPRVDVVYADGTGNAAVETGIPQPVRPQQFDDGSTPEPFEAWTPGPATTVPGVPLACVWVPPGTTGSQPIGPGKIQNRRITAIDATEFITEGEVIPTVEAASDPLDIDIGGSAAALGEATAGRLFDSNRLVQAAGHLTTSDPRVERTIYVPGGYDIQPRRLAVSTESGTGGTNVTVQFGDFNADGTKNVIEATDVSRNSKDITARYPGNRRYFCDIRNKSGSEGFITTGGLFGVLRVA
jgi:hypothetical protein